MNRQLRNILYLSAVIVLIVAAVLYEQSFFDELSNNNISRQAQRYITDKSAQIDKQIETIADQLATGDELWMDNVSNDFIIFVTTRNHVKYWNNNRISPENIPFSAKLSCKRIDNAWFLYKSFQLYHYRIDVLTNIKNNYEINNEYFNNEDADQSDLSHYSLSDVPQVGYYPVFGNNGIPLFYFTKTELNERNQRQSLLASVLYLILFFVTLVFFSSWHRKALINVLSVVIFGIAALLLAHLSIIPIFNKTDLFTNRINIGEHVVSSLGYLSLYAIFCVVFCFCLSKQFVSKKRNVFLAIMISVLLLLSFYCIIYVYTNILHNTSINLQLNRIRNLSSETFWVYGIMILFISGWGRIAYVLTKTFHHHKWFFIYPIIAFLWCWFLFPQNLIPVSFGAFFILVLLITHRRKKKMMHYSFINLLLAGSLLSLMMTLLTEHESNKKNYENRVSLIQSLPTSMLYERDYFVEEELLDIWNEMKEDITLINLSTIFYRNPQYADEFYYDYIRKKYFSEGLKEYDLQTVICTPEYLLEINGTTNRPNCYNYFSNRLYSQGDPVHNTGFYWQRNDNGRVSYLGWLKIAGKEIVGIPETSIFIELESPILSEGRGYPELLRENSNPTSSLPDQSAFARYANGKLITSSGDFRYPPSDKWIPKDSTLLFRTDFDKHSHICYRILDDTCVVLTERKPSFLYPIYAYIYNFLLFCLSFLLIHIFSKKRKIELSRTISTDIRLTMFGVLFISIILIGTASVLFPMKVYKFNLETAINDKGESFLNSISTELAGFNSIHDVSQSSLQGLVQSLSNTLSTDVHIYDLDGRLYASSRPQLFNYKLQGNIINPKAYRAFKYENLTSQMHNETIGNNTYKSIYYVVSNAIEEPIAYINVPFFSSQQDLKKSIYDFVVLLLNLYLILVFIVIIFTFVSIKAITKPLLIIQNGLSKMRLGSNEKIQYDRDDEIGSLVEKYNVMVDELNESVEQLAKNEREIAWQRMARQIAHEIKNPLTPMKLSIQHLARTKSMAPEAFDEFFNKTANTLIEQIDNLSSIATSFSTFAKITDGTPEEIWVNERLNNVVTLFGQSGSHITFEPTETEHVVFIDRDHFIQIFNNLIKNALQAIPKDREGNIIMWTKNDEDTICIFVKDNGKGIDKETRDKIFQPNFTTKNSGMGLGLAISKKMANNAGGDITFTSVMDEGTTFKVELPLKKDN